MRKVLRSLSAVFVAVFLMLTIVGQRLLSAGFLVLALLCGALEKHLRDKEQSGLPINAVQAAVVSHHKVRERVSRNYSVTRCYITFKTTEGQVVEFSVSEIDYDDFDVGETGLLRYRGGEFLSFGVRDKSHIQPIAPLPDEYDRAEPRKQSIVQRIAAWVKAQTTKTDRKSGKFEENRLKSGVLTHELDE